MYVYNGTGWMTNTENGIVAGSEAITTLTANLATTNTTVGGHTTQLNTVDTRIANGVASVETKWAYDSTVNIDGIYKKSGFGLSTNYTSGNGTQANPYTSEFWIDATKLRFTNSNKTGRTAPFTIDASGATPQITFNGKVTFSNISDSATYIPTISSVTTAQTTANTAIANAANAQAAANTANSNALARTLPSEVANAINTNTTTINGSKITTGTVTANTIAGNTITAGNISLGELLYTFNISGQAYVTTGSLGESTQAFGFTVTNGSSTRAMKTTILTTMQFSNGGNLYIAVYTDPARTNEIVTPSVWLQSGSITAYGSPLDATYGLNSLHWSPVTITPIHVVIPPNTAYYTKIWSKYGKPNASAASFFYESSIVGIRN